MAGYSGTPLVKKLGIKQGHCVLLVGPPADFKKTLGKLPDDVRLRTDLRGKAACDVIVFFCKRQSELAKRFPVLSRRLAPAGGLWIGWPKKASGVKTDLSDGVVRETGLKSGLVDNKVCAIDETWSGLRFVIRLKNR